MKQSNRHTVAQLFKNFSPLMEFDGSLPCS